MRQTILPSDPPARFWRPRGVRLPTQPVPFQPGVVFVSAARRSIIGPQHIESVPDLVVETHSPSNWPDDRQERFRVYQTAGVPVKESLGARDRRFPKSSETSEV